MTGEVRVIENWQADTVEVFIFEGPLRENTTSQRIFRHVEGDGWRIEEVGETQGWSGRPIPSVSFRREDFEAIMSQGRKLIPSMRAEDAVDDARATRDRLLELVEHTVKSIERA